MRKIVLAMAAAAIAMTGTSAHADKSSARKKQERGTQEIPLVHGPTSPVLMFD